MGKFKLQVAHRLLIVGDLVVMMLVTIAGFATHGELASPPVKRILAVLLPMIVAWLVILPFSRVYDLEFASQVRHLWRPFLAMVFCTPFALWLRAAWLNTAVIPIFVFVMMGVNSLAMLAWRAIFVLMGRKWTSLWTKSS